MLMKALAASGDVPWPTYTRLLHHCHAVSKDHATAIDTAKYIQQLITGVSELPHPAAVVPAPIASANNSTKVIGRLLAWHMHVTSCGRELSVGRAVG